MFLTPDVGSDELKNCFGYCLGLALRDSGAALHACTAMGNHHHTDLGDRNGELPVFKNRFHSLLARAFNARLGRSDSFWSGDQPCDTRTPKDDDALGDFVYTLTNAVDAGLVKWGHLWPGFTTYGWKFGETRRFYRPKWFFDPDNPQNPDFVDIRLERPDILPHLSDDELHDLLMSKVREREREIQARMRKNGRRFMGLKKLARQKWNQAPSTPEDRFTVVPKVAASSRWLVLAGLQRDRDWEREYAEARENLLAGRDAVFPHGTYWMRVFAAVKVANAPP